MQLISNESFDASQCSIDSKQRRKLQAFGEIILGVCVYLPHLLPSCNVPSFPIHEFSCFCISIPAHWMQRFVFISVRTNERILLRKNVFSSIKSDGIVWSRPDSSVCRFFFVFLLVFVNFHKTISLFLFLSRSMYVFVRGECDHTYYTKPWIVNILPKLTQNANKQKTTEQHQEWKKNRFFFSFESQKKLAKATKRWNEYKERKRKKKKNNNILANETKEMILQRIALNAKWKLCMCEATTKRLKKKTLNSGKAPHVEREQTRN